MAKTTHRYLPWFMAFKSRYEKPRSAIERLAAETSVSATAIWKLAVGYSVRKSTIEAVRWCLRGNVQRMFDQACEEAPLGKYICVPK